VGEARYTIGIDLGTSNCAVAFAKLGGGNTRVEDFGVLQLSRPGEVMEGPLFPSTLYAPMEAERAGGALDLPWVNAGEFVAGQFARWRGAKVPGRVITSAKSWLSHPSVDRTAAILPWGGAADVTKISPVSASAFLLRQMREAWNYKHPEARLEDQEVSITVPASFDESARSLTVQAAREAGIEKFILLEEPQAAFYDFSHENERRLAELLREVRLVLVIDIGGGTTDFTLVQVEDGRSEIEVKGEKKEQGGIVLKRVAVGDHLILGGDNMDSALAHRVEQSLGGK
jgi:molecular chaperone DnaK (HSP70)